MNRKIFIMLLSISMLLITGCEKEEALIEKKTIEKKLEESVEIEKEKEELPEYNIGDYFPFEENKISSYLGKGSEYADQKVYVEYIDGDKIQFKIENPGTNMVKVLENKNGELKEVYIEGEFYHIENMINANTNSQDVLLKEPLILGNTWDSLGFKKEITAVDIEVETPLKTFESLEVTTFLENGALSKEYYSKGIGLVKKTFIDGDMKIESILEKEENQARRYEIKSYYPNALDGKIVEVQREIAFNTNDRIEEILESIMKDSVEDNYLQLISDNTNINSLYLDRNSWAIEIDFSKEMIEDLNLGASLEYDVLDSIAKTLGSIYDVDKVFIKVDGKEYNSGHIRLEKNEPIIISKK